jgi:hypothetical protein
VGAQAGDQLAPHAGVADLGEQRRREDQVGHDPRGQQAQALLGGAGLGEDLIDHLERHDRR